MANTEGMPDEVMASLLSQSPDTHELPTSRQAARQSLQQRLDRGMGDRPAATVVRRSNPRAANCVGEETKESQAICAHASTRSSPIVILGSVVERPIEAGGVSHASRIHSRVPHSVPRSRFTADRSMTVKGCDAFPSVNVPLGTFVKQSAHRVRVKATAKPSQAKHRPVDKSLEESSWNDADAMMKQMSPNEITESVQELRAALSPDTLAFLKERRLRKRTAPAEAHGPCTASPHSVATGTRSMSHITRQVDEVKEKGRLAQLMSSVRNYDDMDEVYATEIGQIHESLKQGITLEGDEDFDVACELLRSTNPRQTLWAAQAICQRLENDVQCGKSYYYLGTTPWPYPTVLPVSLRCLLDAQMSASFSFVLRTLVLRSLYALQRLGAHCQHVVDTTGESYTPNSFCQEFFLKDIVLSPSPRSCYPSKPPEEVVSNEDGEAMAYVASSSLASAQTDGEAFTRDPMWTLLSRMKILPCLAQVLSSAKQKSRLPEEALTAICGILSMLCLRSPGAASAIVQHPSLIPSLLQLALLPPCDDAKCTPTIKLAALILLCTLARQSRLAASSLPLGDILPQLLALKPETIEEYRAQKWALILWRTLLRYGLGLTHLQTFITILIPPLLVSSPEWTIHLSPECNTCFAAVLQCVKITARKSRKANRRLVSHSIDEILAEATAWLNPAVRQAADQCRELNKSFDIHDVSEMRVWAGRLRILHAYASFLEQLGEIIEDRNSTYHWELLQSAAISITTSTLLSNALQCVPLCTCLGHPRSDDSTEATACAFLEALASLTTILGRRSTFHQVDELCGTFMKMIVQWLRAPSCGGPMRPVHSPTARVGWLNTTYFAVCNALVTASERIGSVGMDMSMFRSIVFTLITTLHPGEEAMAVVLFSHDFLFQPKIPSPTKSIVSSLFIKELCAMDGPNTQLDHSFKLQNGFGMSTDGWGAFEIDSLLPEADSELRGRSPDALLPLGRLFIWKTLASVIEQDEIESSGADGLHACLDLLMQLEQEANASETAFACQIPAGAKLYYLLNVCLQPESVVGDERVAGLVIALYDIYLSLGLHDSQCLFRSFSVACLEHAQSGRESMTREDRDKMDSSDEKVLAMLTYTDSLSKRELNALNNFVIDMCTSYTEYGAQYEVFTKCIRLFLCAAFPRRIRCETIQRLSDVLHLLTLPGERENECALQRPLEESLDADMALRDKAEIHVDHPDLMDLVSCAIGKDVFTHEGFFFTFAVASLARNLAASIRMGSRNSALGAFLRRLKGVDSATIALIVDIAKYVLASNVDSTTGLVQSTLHSFKEYRTMRRLIPLEDALPIDDGSWNTVLSDLRAVHALRK